MLIEQSALTPGCLTGHSVLVTGGGGGIGFEAARALAWLGAHVIIAEIDEAKGAHAERAINQECTTGRVSFFPMDIGDPEQIDALYGFVEARVGALDVILNNATVAPIGAVDSLDISAWDRSYQVNLRAPVLLVHRFLPDMKHRRQGTIVFVPSSGAAPFMGAYEVFKTAQVELCNTLSAELEGTGIVTYAIGPGLVQTDTAREAIETVAGLMQMTPADLYALNAGQILSAEAAGTGFAISVALAERYNGQEIAAIQALTDGGVWTNEEEAPVAARGREAVDAGVCGAVAGVVATYVEQHRGWMARNVFERQWILRDIKKTVGKSADEIKAEILTLGRAAEEGDVTALERGKPLLAALTRYYERQRSLLEGYEKNRDKREAGARAIESWIAEIRTVLDALG